MNLCLFHLPPYRVFFCIEVLLQSATNPYKDSNMAVEGEERGTVTFRC